MRVPGTPERRRGFRRVEQDVREACLILDRQADEVRLRDRPLGGFMGGGDDEITDAPALNFSGPLHDHQGIRCDTRLDP